MAKPSTKSQVLSLLEANNSKPLSGSEIAVNIGISRNSVWKAVKTLKSEGYDILGINNSGYTLSPQNNALSSPAIYRNLKNKDIISDIVIKKETGSTNDDAKLLGHDGAESGIVVLADHQTAGKGRRGKSFFSPSGSGIYMSIMLRPEAKIEQSLLITSAAAVAVCRAIKSLYDIDCQIKWVNDVYIKGKKLVGILTEASINFENQSLDYVVVGIGINITTNSFPPELSDIVTSLSEHTQSFVSRNELIAAVVDELLTIISTDLEKREFLKESKRLSYLLGKDIVIIYNDRTEDAVAIDINENGYLVVKNKSGELITINSGEVSIRKKK